MYTYKFIFLTDDGVVSKDYDFLEEGDLDAMMYNWDVLDITLPETDVYEEEGLLCLQ